MNRTAVEDVRLLERGEHDEWRALVEESAGEPLFSVHRWVDNMARAFGGEAEVLGRFEGGELVGGVALPVRRRAGLAVATAPYLMPYFPIVTRGKRRRIVRALLPEIARRYALVGLLPSPSEEDVRPYLSAGWDVALRYTCRLPLAGESPESILARFEPESRRRVRKLDREGIGWRLSDDPAIHRALVWASYARHGSEPPYSEKAAARVHRKMLDDGDALLFELLRGEEVVATHLVGVDAKRAYSLESGVDPEQGKKGEAYALVMRLLAELVRRKVSEFDFLGVNHPTISRFKEAFGGELVRYHAAAPVRPLWLRWLMRLRGIPSELEYSPRDGGAGRP